MRQTTDPEFLRRVRNTLSGLAAGSSTLVKLPGGTTALERVAYQRVQGVAHRLFGAGTYVLERHFGCMTVKRLT